VAETPHGAGELSQALRAALFKSVLPVILLLMLAGFALVEERVLSPANLVNILVQASYLTVFASAQTLVILTRGFDLSLGTTVSMVSVIAALVMTGWAGSHEGALVSAITLGCLAALLAGMGIGLINGACVALLRVSPFVVTLGTLNIALGIASTISAGSPVFGLPDAFNRVFAQTDLLGVPAPVIIAAALVLLTHLLLAHTVWGRSVYLLGGNPRAAHVAGLPRRIYLTLAYVVCSFYGAIGALMLTARTGSGEPGIGGNLTLESIAAAVIGGVALRGGEGGALSAVIGALFVTVLSNGMNFVRVDGYVQMIVLGIVVIAGVFIDRLRVYGR
jgi:ribose/xylose/arabinose/galactoside ABC-type transport system permease subunit